MSPIPSSLSVSALARGLILAVALGLAALAALAPPWGLDPGQGAVAGLCLAVIALWGTGLTPSWHAALILFAGLVIPGLAPPGVAFSGFASPALWLVVSGFVIGAAISGAGLGARMAGATAPALGRSYPALIFGLLGLRAGLAFLMPSSMGRAAVLAPLGVALAEGMGFAPGSRGRVGVAVAVALGANMPGFAILPANVPNVVLAGAAADLHGIGFAWADYLALHFPVLGLVKTLAIGALILALFPARAVHAAPEAPARAPWRRDQLLLSGILLVTLALWSTDRLHGISPAWVGLGVSVLLLAPLPGMPGPGAFKGAVDFPTLVFTAGALGLGAAMAHSGVGAAVASRAAAALPLAPGADFGNFLSLAGLAAATGAATTLPGAPAVLTPLAPALAEASGMRLESVLMTQALGFSTVFLPYQAPPLILAMGLMGERPRELMRVLPILGAITFLVLVPLDFLWWRLLGWI